MAELCQIIEEWLEISRRDGEPLPPPTAGGGYSDAGNREGSVILP